ncbi:hypothetical protein [Streptomyces mirabilis]|uniref:hypothetical protein n=1 Tax=Streptomyces mirabilis TaxID=68239 RepID=UPI00364EE7B7
MTTRQRSISSSTDSPVPGEVVLGVDTHGEVHVAAVVSPLGKVLGTESFGAGLSRYLLAQHVQVYEVNRPDRTGRRLLGE